MTNCNDDDDNKVQVTTVHITHHESLDLPSMINLAIHKRDVVAYDVLYENVIDIDVSSEEELSSDAQSALRDYYKYHGIIPACPNCRQPGDYVTIIRRMVDIPEGVDHRGISYPVGKAHIMTLHLECSHCEHVLGFKLDLPYPIERF